MIALHGFSRSNYYRLARAVLIEKGIDFDIVKAVPSSEPELLAHSPMGRVPFLTVGDVSISETWAIIDYAEQIQPEPALLPTEPLERAKTIELIRHLELNIELVARRCLAAAFFGGNASDELVESTRADLKRGMKAVSTLLAPTGPFLRGKTFSTADLYAHYTFILAPGICEKVMQFDLLADYPILRERLAAIAERPSIAAAEA
ncbi:MAG: glutathione S-transferase family protein [Pseudomonadaceae bacterium]|nr:glutathione S-transferase family protein [Pseudomonadaceae bacterium]